MNARTYNIGDWDEANHASASFFVYNFIGDWFKNPSFSFDELKQRAVDYHAHYKYFSVLFIYPPLDMMFSVLIYMLFGVSIFTTNLATILEAILVLFFVYKLAKLFFGDNFKKGEGSGDAEKGNKSWDIFPTITMVLVAFNALFFTIATKNYIDMMLLLFMVSTSYFFIRFLKRNDTFYLYLSSISLALGIMSKQPMLFMIPILVLVFLWEKRLKGLKEYYKQIIKSFIVFSIVLTPMLIQICLLFSQGLFDIYLQVWYFNPSVGGSDIMSWLPTLSSATLEKIIVNSYLLFYQWFLIPFFLIGLYYLLKRRTEADKIILLVIAVFFYFFLVKIHCTSFVRFMFLIMPFAMIISVSGLMKIRNISKAALWKKFYVFMIILFVLASVFQTFTFDQAAISRFPVYGNVSGETTTDFKTTAIFLSEEMTEPATVLTTFGHLQMFEFARWDKNRYIYSMYVPYTKDDWEKALTGDFSYRASEKLWQSYGINYDQPKYVVIHENQFVSARFFYDIDYFLSDDRFELIKIIDGSRPGDRTFIFKIITT